MDYQKRQPFATFASGNSPVYTQSLMGFGPYSPTNFCLFLQSVGRALKKRCFSLRLDVWTSNSPAINMVSDLNTATRVRFLRVAMAFAIARAPSTLAVNICSVSIV